MIDIPETRYVKAGEGYIAYQTVGEGAVDLVFISGWFSHVDGRWELPAYAHFLERLASFSRLVLLDQRGTGASDPPDETDVDGLEAWADDILAVMDAAGSERAVIFGSNDGGPVAMIFSATHPARTSGLILGNTFPKAFAAEDYPWGLPQDVGEAVIDALEETWGASTMVDTLAPDVHGDESLRRWWSRYFRMSGSPARAAAMTRRIAMVDVRHILPVIRVPTLVLHRKAITLIPVEHGRFMAEQIPDAKLVELEGAEPPIFLGNADDVLDEVEEFITGVRHGPDPARFLATILFTDVVDSTAHAARIGDRRWRQVLDVHDDLIRRMVEKFRGKVIDISGDSALATFDGPARAVECARALGDAVQSVDLHLRVGLHTGEVERRGEDITGLGVTIARRVCDRAGAGEVLVSRTVVDLVAGSGIDFEERGDHDLKGVPGQWRLFQLKER